MPYVAQPCWMLFGNPRGDYRWHKENRDCHDMPADFLAALFAVVGDKAAEGVICR